jgi:hypothetical protein
MMLSKRRNEITSPLAIRPANRFLSIVAISSFLSARKPSPRAVVAGTIPDS